MAIALDQAFNGTETTAASMTITGVSWATNALLLVATLSNGSTVNNIADNSGTGTSGSWVQRAVTPSITDGAEVWWVQGGVSASGVTITITFNASSLINANFFSVVGHNTLTPFDGTATTYGGAGSPISDSTFVYTTTNANCLVYAAARGGTSASTAGTGPPSWTVTAAAAAHMVVEYAIVPAASTLCTGNWTVGTNNQNGEIMDAIVQAPVVLANLPPTFTQSPILQVRNQAMVY